MDRSQKAAVIEAIKGRADNASFAVLTDFKGMTVEELTSLRDSLRKAGGEYYVVKNTLARIAFTGGPHDVVKDKFHENCAIALGFDDPVAVAKALSEFAKKSKLFSMRAASLEGKEMTPAQVEALATLPSKEQLLGQVLGLEGLIRRHAQEVKLCLLPVAEKEVLAHGHVQRLADGLAVLHGIGGIV